MVNLQNCSSVLPLIFYGCETALIIQVTVIQNVRMVQVFLYVKLCWWASCSWVFKQFSWCLHLQGQAVQV